MTVSRVRCTTFRWTFRLQCDIIIIFLNIQFIGLPESVLPQPVPNRTYYSLENTLSLYSEFVGSDGFDCKWNTVPKENTTKFYCIIFIFL
jgi:hypothetical protein